MCNIGHETLLHSMKRWQIRSALRGMNRSQHGGWEQTRQLAWWVLSALGAKDLHKPTDLCKFPWDSKKADTSNTTPEDVRELQEMMRRMNEESKQSS